MDAVEQGGRVELGSRRAVLSNSLVVIGHPSFEGKFSQPQDLCELGFRFLALGDPDAVPAGRYAKEWLESIEHDGATVWECVEDHVSPTPDVRAALGQVEANPDVLGIVYRTDYMAARERVKLLYEVPAEDGPQISYSVARLKDSARSDAAQQFLDFLNSETARSIFTKHGFLVTNPALTTAESVE
jgi:molybdate transport system substrate-binding protein